MLFGAHAHRILESILLSPYFHDTRNVTVHQPRKAGSHAVKSMASCL